MPLTLGIGISGTLFVRLLGVTVGTLTDTNEAANEIASNAAAGTAVSGITWSHDLGAPAVYSLTDDAGGRVTIDSITGQVQRTATGTLSTSHNVTVRAETIAGRYADATITITVLSAVAPRITSNGGGATADITITEGETAITTVVADGAPMEYSISGGADSSFFTIGAATGELAFASAPDYSDPQDAGADNGYVVEVTASDGVRSDTQTITATVTEALGAEQWAHPNFDATSGFQVVQSNWTVAGGTATSDGGSGNIGMYNETAPPDVKVGRTYRATVTIDSISTGSVRYGWDGFNSDYGTATTAGTHTIDFVCAFDDYLYLRANASDCVISYHSVKEVL